MIYEDHYARCDECRASTGKFSSKLGVQKRIDQDGWKTKFMGDVLCPACNPDCDVETIDTVCDSCDNERQRPPGTECAVCGDGELIVSQQD